MVKSAYYDKNGVKKGAWSPAEDKKLREYVQRYGHWNWREIPKFAGLSRCGKSCRLRWMNYLRPDVKLGKYTKEEDEIIIKLHEEHGNKWSIIASKLPGRTDNEIKNHWHTHLKKQAKENPTTSSKMKEQQLSSTEDSEAESNINIPADHQAGPSHYILESSPVSSETCSSDFSSLSSHHHAIQSGRNYCAVEDALASSSETPDDDEFGGDFWTQPFLADNSSFIQNTCPLVPLLDGGFVSPYVSYHDDGVDLFWDLG